MFYGSCTAIVTPFTHDDAIDYPRFEALIEWQIASGTKALVVLGTTGETPTITDEEQYQIMKFAIQRVNHRVPVIIGTGSNATAKAIKHTQMAQSLGADAALIVNPYYNKSSQAGIIKHYEAILAATDIPIVLYNVPSRTGANLSPALVAKLKVHPRIVGIKQATSDLAELVEMAMLVDDGFKLFCGNDDMISAYMSLGASGVISVVSNILPEAVAQLCETQLQGDLSGARSLQFQLKPLIDALFMVTNPIPVKAALALMGKIEGHLRLPLYPLDTAQNDQLRQALHRYGVALCH